MHSFISHTPTDLLTENKYDRHNYKTLSKLRISWIQKKNAGTDLMCIRHQQSAGDRTERIIFKRANFS